jgi:hypothetical protein
MQTVNLHKSGLTLGVLIGLSHALWAALVGLGLAQPIVDFLFWMHFIKPIYTIGPFNIGIAVVLITVTSIIGYVTGLLLAGIWNFIQK